MTHDASPDSSIELDPDSFRELGYRAIDEIASCYESLDERPVFPGQKPTAVEALVEESLPETGQDPSAILDEWTETVLPAAAHNTSPRYFGFVMGSGTTMGVLADALAASVNMNTGGWKPAPSGTEIERRTIRWLAEMLGYDTDCGGLMTSGGTMANVTAILTGLREVADYDTKTRACTRATDPASTRSTWPITKDTRRSIGSQNSWASGGTRFASFRVTTSSEWTWMHSKRR